MPSADPNCGKCVVISQPMYFPWVGLLEQIRLCDTFVYYSDVQFSRGSFSNRVQVKTARGREWLTVPLRNLHLGQAINEVEVDYTTDWRTSQRSRLKQSYAGAPYAGEMLALVDSVFSQEHRTLAELARASTDALVRYFPTIAEGTQVLESGDLGVGGASTERVVNLCAKLEATRYLTGHGARNYLDHQAFERRQIGVCYMSYGLEPYPQMHGEFSPHVSSLDLIANCGPGGVDRIQGRAVPWRDFLGASR